MIRSNKKFIPVMLMPFTEDKKIDYKVLKDLVEFYLNAGAEGLFANCLSSEMFELGKDEMIDSINFIVNEVHGRVPIVATGSFGNTISEQADFIKEVYATGIEAVIVITSLLAEENDEESLFEDNVRKLMELTPNIPLGFYECPIPYKRIMSPTFLSEIVQSDRIKYYKDTSLDLNSIKSKLHATQGFPEFGLFDAYMVHAVGSLQAGSAGLSCIQGNYFPELIVWLCKNYDDPNLQVQIDKVQNFLIENMDVMHYAYPASAKYFLQLTGFEIQTSCRRTDIEPLDDETKEKLKQLKISYDQLKL
ncbi:dihydrodipicolinate synthase family protein [Sphingobacterium mizutaii NBRC 14946 = DSM 11724]|uniref:Dihydrodipicolinate synthase family protein n=2 Tax=Sphingobacterium mizutaii TaxID=1010 RepID=A0ABQ0W745_9SPHI|nr:dihydrodipicolinate synthase family protein [Sphingobacterium mizutaii]GEM67886.1 dihydrodipicolinate synthase family protein [Sphingobacterium mizutaii NBRC 14946 = DSM 11724]SDK95183.1 4-hydroxy-tetrahydrodipicolinate synthase [Sphingobacterium mizutaii]SNV48714.1 Probable 2-keto-3-deoxy-galactonate aldolase YagE [Sphingobacterium mizutaii]